MTSKIHQESLFIPVSPTDELHLRRFYRRHLGPPVLMIHGSIENGRIFYSKNGKGLAPYLARKGFDVYVGDLRGRGESSPPIGRFSNYGQTEAIIEDIPTMSKAIGKIRKNTRQHWIAHSWGGVLMNAALARDPRLLRRVETMVCFASKRTIRVFNLEKFFTIDLLWNRLGPVLTFLCGYLPAKEVGFGSDNETRKSHIQNKLWVEGRSEWVDTDDRFDYGKAIQKLSLPPTLHLVGIADSYLGNPKDVHDFLMETGVRRYHYRILSKEGGNQHDYDHLNLLTHPDAEWDHFPMVLRWLKDPSYRKELYSPTT
jgi:pimeloyl-ACP methyl ester carboxylesterase